MTIDNARLQDVARPHKRTRGTLAPETDALLKRYRATMEAELADLLSEIRPDAGQLTIGGDVSRPPLEMRRALWDLAIKLGRELGTTTEAQWSGVLDSGSDPLGGRRADVKPPRISARERRALGGV